MSTARRQRIQAVSEDASVTQLELFFDLVFVYALTQVTALMASGGRDGHTATGRSVLEGMLVLALVWWCWVGFSWLGNSLQADEGVARMAFLLVMATMFVAALAIPDAFGGASGHGLSGPMIFAGTYAVVRLIHIALFAYAARDAADAGLQRQLSRFAVVMTASIALTVVGAAVGGNAQVWIWLGAIAVDYVGTQAIGAAGWRLRSAGHFVERHGLIVIVALGESIVAVGVGVGAVKLSAAIMVASALGIALIGAMWWVYFDVTALAAERRFAATSGEEQARIARDAYTFIHLPMIAGIALAALGLKKVLGYVSGTDGHDWSDVIHGVPPLALHGGVALYLLSIVALRVRITRTFGRSRPAATVALLATIPLGQRVPATIDLAIVAGIAVALVSFEANRYAETRHRVRHLDGHGTGEPPAK